MSDNQLQQLLAASALIVTLEKICTRGLLSESDESDARRLIVRAGRVFNLDSIAERPLESSSDQCLRNAVTMEQHPSSLRGAESIDAKNADRRPSRDGAERSSGRALNILEANASAVDIANPSAHSTSTTERTSRSAVATGRVGHGSASAPNSKSATFSAPTAIENCTTIQINNKNVAGSSPASSAISDADFEADIAILSFEMGRTA